MICFPPLFPNTVLYCVINDTIAFAALYNKCHFVFSSVLIPPIWIAHIHFCRLRPNGDWQNMGSYGIMLQKPIPRGMLRKIRTSLLKSPTQYQVSCQNRATDGQVVIYQQTFCNSSLRPLTVSAHSWFAGHWAEHLNIGAAHSRIEWQGRASSAERYCRG